MSKSVEKNESMPVTESSYQTQSRIIPNLRTSTIALLLKDGQMGVVSRQLYAAKKLALAAAPSQYKGKGQNDYGQ